MTKSLDLFTRLVDVGLNSDLQKQTAHTRRGAQLPKEDPIRLCGLLAPLGIPTPRRS